MPGVSRPAARRLPRRGPSVIASESESVLQDKVIKLARMLGWRVYHSWTSIHSASGWPDLAMVRRGRLIFAELKSEDGVVTPDQQAWLHELSSLPHIDVFVWRPSDWPRIVEVLRR